MCRRPHVHEPQSLHVRLRPHTTHIYIQDLIRDTRSEKREERNAASSKASKQEENETGKQGREGEIRGWNQGKSADRFGPENVVLSLSRTSATEARVRTE